MNPQRRGKLVAGHRIPMSVSSQLHLPCVKTEQVGLVCRGRVGWGSQCVRSRFECAPSLSAGWSVAGGGLLRQYIRDRVLLCIPVGLFKVSAVTWCELCRPQPFLRWPLLTIGQLLARRWLLLSLLPLQHHAKVGKPHYKWQAVYERYTLGLRKHGKELNSHISSLSLITRDAKLWVSKCQVIHAFTSFLIVRELCEVERLFGLTLIINCAK